MSAYDMEQFIRDLQSNGLSLTDEIYNYLSSVDQSRLKDLLTRLRKIRELKPSVVVSSRSAKGRLHATKKAIEGKKSYLTGKIFENIIQLIFDGCECINHYSNIRTTISEIDFLLSVGPTASISPFFKQVSNHAIGEAKCYSSGVKIEWINELVGVMQAHSTQHGILFVASPQKTMRTDQIQALQLHSARGNHVVPFGMTQLHQVANGDNFLKVLGEQFTKVLNGQHSLAI